MVGKWDKKPTKPEDNITKTRREMKLLDQAQGILEEQMEDVSKGMDNTSKFKRTEWALDEFIARPEEAKKNLRKKVSKKLKVKRCKCK